MKCLFTTLSFFLFLQISCIQAQTHTFNNNSGDNNWHNPNNWDAGSVPTSNSDVIILDGFEVHIQTKPAYSNTIILSGASVLQVENALTIQESLDISFLGELKFMSGSIQGGVIDNQGVFSVLETDLKTLTNTTLENNGIIAVEENATIDFATSTTLNNTLEGIIAGDGTLTINGDFINEGGISPGEDQQIGTLTFENTFSVDGGSLLLDIIDEITHDSIEIIGTAEVDGTIVLNSENLTQDFYTIDVITTSQGVVLCNLPDTVTADNGGGIIMRYNVLCEADNISLELYEAFIFSVNENQIENAFLITPNPALLEVLFQLDPTYLDIANAEIIITDIQGKEVSRIKQLSEKINFQKGTVQSGVYFVTLMIESKKITTKKIVFL